MSAWQPATFKVAFSLGAQEREGLEYRGLGLFKLTDGSPKGRRPTTWSLTHLNTGHRVDTLRGDQTTVLRVATEIAEAGDWDFLSLEGWKDRFPDAYERICAIRTANPKITDPPPSKKIEGYEDWQRKIAQEISSARS